MTLGSKHLRIAAVLLLAAAAAAESVKAPTPAAIESPEARILSALSTANIPAPYGKMQLLAPLSLNNPSAAFRVMGIEKWQENSAMARIRCMKSGDCMPFYILLRWPSTEERDASLHAPVLLKARPQPHTSKDVAVRSGDKVTLVLQNEKFRIVTPVTCLENGVVGQTIRVRRVDNKKIQLAEVEESGVVKGIL